MIRYRMILSLLLDVASLENEIEVVYTLYLLHLSREGFVFILGVLNIHNLPLSSLSPYLPSYCHNIPHSYLPWHGRYWTSHPMPA